MLCQHTMFPTQHSVSTFASKQTIKKNNVWHCCSLSVTQKRIQETTSALSTLGMEFHLETSIVSWIEKYFQETLVPPLYMWHSSSIWKTSKTDSLPISLPPNHLIILKRGGSSLQPPPLSAVNYCNHLSLNCTPKKFCSKSNFSYFIWIMYNKVCVYVQISQLIQLP